MLEKAISVRQLYKRFGGFLAVRGVSFDVECGRCVGLLGPNGAGKTTTLKVLYGMCRRDADSASVRVLGFDPARDELEIKCRSGVVPQDDNLDSELKVRQNLLVYAKFYGLPGDVARQRIDELLHFFEIADKRDARIRELSGGMKRRLLIARALINNPKLLILDEPTTGLDPQVRHLIWDKIRHLKREGVTILITTHYMEEAFQLCDKVIIMNEGVIVAEGDPAELISGKVERFVLEIIRPERMEGDVARLVGAGMRVERALGTAFIYSDEDAGLRSILASLPPGAAHIRPSNLEDLFIRLTGRKLNEAQ
jgi:lipooligosaccharide transport system ATP-binding protein